MNAILETPGALEVISQLIKTEIDNYSVEQHASEHRNHLGASIVGNDCLRYSWLVFRWAKLAIHSGRMERLFQRGHDEEQKIIDLLTGIGFTIYQVDPATGKQIRISGSGGHYGGSIDSAGYFPPRYQVPIPLLFEFKTHNDKSFVHLVKHKVILAKPMHWAQMCEYGAKWQLQYGIYIAVNKNDDDLHIELLKLDWSIGDEYIKRADTIIRMQTAPPKAGLNEAFHLCKYCSFKDICHQGKPIEKNCRSCIHAKPVEEAEWQCDFYNRRIPEDFIKQGCGSWHAIVKPGE